MREASTANTIFIGCIICIGVGAFFYFNPYRRYYSSFYHTITSNNNNNNGVGVGGGKQRKKSDGSDGDGSSSSSSGGGEHSSNSTDNKSTQSVGSKRTTKARSRYVVEVCLSDIQSLIEACQGSCNSIELCVNRLEGGITPSYALIEHCVRVIASSTTTSSTNTTNTTNSRSSSSRSSSSSNRSIDLHVLIRPRPGGFHYTDAEFDIIQRDVLIAKQLGADGIVFGALHDNGSIDIERMRIIRKLSEGMILTFHRAFDVCRTDQPMIDVLEQIISLGCDRLLTSGSNESNAINNLSALQVLVKLARGRIVIVAASGIGVENVRQIITSTGVRAVHAGSSITEVRRGGGGGGVISNTSCINNSNSSGFTTDQDGPSKELLKTIPSTTVSSTSSPLPTTTTSTTTTATTTTSGSSNILSDMVGWSCASRSLVSQLVYEANLAWKIVETEGINYSRNTSNSSSSNDNENNNNNSHDDDHGDNNHDDYGDDDDDDNDHNDNGRGDVDDNDDDDVVVDGSDMVLVEAVDAQSPQRKVLPRDSTYVYVSGE